jgi:ADP-glucose type glycogen/starch synthase
MGLDRLLRSRDGDLSAILNGVDRAEFDPARDPKIEAWFDASSLERKAANKEALQRRSHLMVDPGTPVVGMVTRLAGQKGVDLVLGALEELVALGVQVVVSGVGDRGYGGALEEAARRYRGGIAYHATDSEAMARKVYAGSDLFLAPSSYEPCGLAPLIALRYGAIPVVRHTGGLAETIPDVTRDPRTGLGFGFDGRRSRDVVSTVRRAVKHRGRADAWEGLRRRAMAAGFSWHDAARAYERLYLRALAGPPGRAPSGGT